MGVSEGLHRVPGNYGVVGNGGAVGCVLCVYRTVVPGWRWNRVSRDGRGGWKRL